MTRVLATALLLLPALAAAPACAVDPGEMPIVPVDNTGTVTPVGPPLAGLHVVGTHIETADGATVVLRGVNRSGTEYQCVHGAGFFDGPATTGSVAAIASWK